ncbi:histidine kinase internal protein [Plesiocystis pacifica SIR-1]|uniref:Histidine kinase internal protein n=1 Tax=Plesiocystis pacifica SIR-1 TaxID=391625 RepID=A6FYA1_9BACT|nr:histidine kinase [Plesiocystis pacifica]EDM81480.1 histidine kinase internal protein [Plesiocystis pacifica SIR-1]
MPAPAHHASAEPLEPPRSSLDRGIEHLPALAHLGFWALASATIAALAALSADGEPWRLALGGAALGALGFALSTVAMRLLQPPSPARVLAVIAGLSLAWTGSILAFDDDPGAPIDHLGTAVFVLVLSAFWTSVILAARHAVALHHEQRSHALARAERREALLQALQSQLEPHFLFNALNTLAVKIDEDPPQAQRMLELLAQLLRDAFDEGAGATMADEFARLETYLEFQRQRFEDTLDAELSLDPALAGHHCPPFLLQPLVENAIRHGTRDAQGIQRVRVSARAAGAEACCEVRNSGALAGELELGTGLDNTRRRLATSYGERGVLRLDAADGQVQTTLRFPLRSPPGEVPSP